MASFVDSSQCGIKSTETNNIESSGSDSCTVENYNGGLSQSDIDFADSFLNFPLQLDRPIRPAPLIVSTNTPSTTMIPDTARTFPELSDVSKPNYLPEFIYSGLDEYFNPEDFEHLLLNDSALDEDLYPNTLDDEYYQSALYDDQYLYNLHEEPYQEKLNAAAIEAAALKSFQVLVAPELCHIVNPNEIFPNHFAKKDDSLKIKVNDEVVLNNALSGENAGEIEYVKAANEVHNDHSYFKENGVTKIEIKKEVESEVEEEVVCPPEIFVPKNVVIKVEAPVVKRPVGRPRKTAITTKPVKRSAAHFDEETNEEFVDVESIDVKRPRKAPRAKAPARAPAKKAAAPRRKVSKPTYCSEESSSPSHFQAIDPLNPNGYVMRQAKTSAIKKIAKTKKGPAVSRSKRSDHNDMERKRRHEMRDLFEELKVLVPTELLVDDNNKIKKNPSKNTILVGSRKYIEMLYDHKKSRNSLVKQNQKLQKRYRKYSKILRKRCKKLLARRKC